MPKVRASSGTIGTTCLPTALSLSSLARTRTKTIVVETSRSEPVSNSFQKPASGSGSASLRALRLGSGPPSARRRSRRYCTSSLVSPGW